MGDSNTNTASTHMHTQRQFGRGGRRIGSMGAARRPLPLRRRLALPVAIRALPVCGRCDARCPLLCRFLVPRNSPINFHAWE